MPTKEEEEHEAHKSRVEKRKRDKENGDPGTPKPERRGGDGEDGGGGGHNLDDMAKEDIEGALQDLELPQFDPTTIKKDALCMVVGKRRFGKSVFVQWCLSVLWKYYPDGAYVFTTTKHNQFWQQHVPDSRVYPGFDWDVIQQILDVQMEKHLKRQETGEKHLGHVVLIFDDCISDRHDARYAEDLLRLVFNGRHYQISIWLLTQDIKGFFPDVRANVDYAMLTYQIQTRQTKTLRDDFADFFPNRATFAELLRRNTQDYQLLVIDQSNAKYSLDDGVFSVAKAEEKPKPYRIGDAKFWYESGCLWEDQLKRWENLQKSEIKDDDWDELADKRIKESEEFEEKTRSQTDQFRTAAWYAAQGSQRERMEKEALKNAHGYTKAAKMVSDLDMFINSTMFIPTGDGYVKFDDRKEPEKKKGKYFQR